jgi:tetratricopeptide (TPR) repeat protein
MLRSAGRVAAICLFLALSGCVAAALAPAGASRTVVGPRADPLVLGAQALEAGRAREGISLTLAGLARVSESREAAAAHSNLCAGYAMLQQWDEALGHCNRALELDPANWRSWNNRAAVFVARGEYERAISDVNSGLRIAPDSAVLLRSLEVVREHQRAQRDSRKHSMPA